MPSSWLQLGVGCPFRLDIFCRFHCIVALSGFIANSTGRRRRVQTSGPAIALWSVKSTWKKTATSKSTPKKIAEVYVVAIFYGILMEVAILLFLTTCYTFSTQCQSLWLELWHVSHWSARVRPCSQCSQVSPRAFWRRCAGQRFLSQLSTVNLQLATFLGLLAVAVSRCHMVGSWVMGHPLVIETMVVSILQWFKDLDDFGVAPWLRKPHLWVRCPSCVR